MIEPKMLLHDEELDTNVIVALPEISPRFSLGSLVTAKVPYSNGDNKVTYYEVDGQVVGYEGKAHLDTETGEQSFLKTYILRCDDYPNEPIECTEEEIVLFQVNSNEFAAEYYKADAEEEGPQEDEGDEEERVVTEADILASQERAANGYGIDV